MKNIIKYYATIAAMLIFSSCEPESLPQNIVFLKINGEQYSSYDTEDVMQQPSGYLEENFFSYKINLISSDDDMCNISICVEEVGLTPLEIYERYPVSIASTRLVFHNREYYATEGWVEFTGFSRKDSESCAIYGNFIISFTSNTGDIIEVTEGYFGPVEIRCSKDSYWKNYGK